MKQFILNSEPDSHDRVRLKGGDYRYLVQARRLAPGEYFPALLPNGNKVTVQVVSVDNKTLVGEIAPSAPAFVEEVEDAAAHNPPHIILFQSLPKGEKMDIIVRQAAEGAIAEIVPFVSEFAVSVTVSDSKFSRWQRIVKEARQQSGSPVATTIRQPMSVDGLFDYWLRCQSQYQSLLGILFHHLPLANTRLHRYLGSNFETVVLAIGPEGGFSPAEAERFMAAGFLPFTFEGPILRTETAALYAQAAVRILLWEKDSWEIK